MNLPKFKRVLIKLGTQIVIDESGAFANNRISSFIKNIRDNQPIEFLIVTSGAVGLGKSALKLSNKKINTTQKQACAAVGQSLLMNSYNKILLKYNLTAAQLLVTAEDLTDRQKYLNFSETLNELLKLKSLPIINENDSISTVELESESKSFGDNDKLSSLIASKMNVDLLVILTNVDGIYTDNPHKNTSAQKISLIKNFDDLKQIKAEGTSNLGRGGLKTKIEAAKVASLNGVFTIIANGNEKNILNKILSLKTWDKGAPGTLIVPADRISQKKNWIGFSSNTKGILIVNSGAALALRTKKASLLPIGIVDIKGDFKAGDVVSIQTENAEEIGRGVSGFSGAEIKRLMGTKSKEVIHRDYLVIYRDYQL